MPHDDHDQQLQLLHAEIDRLTKRLLRYKQDIARNKRTAELLQRLSPELSERIGEDVLGQLLEAEGDRAAEQATDEFPEFLGEIEDRARRREPSPCCLTSPQCSRRQSGL
jgi:hypothetical protein